MGKNLTELKFATDILPDLIRWENSDLNQTETVELFQSLIDSGLAWELQGHYGRTAKRFIDAGLCHFPGKTPGLKSAGPRPLSIIAREIVADWKKVYFGAVPYLRAMGEMGDISEPYYQDSGPSVVRYFLSNATTWRGSTARRVKLELKAMLKTGNV